jgi:hypothetical protein
MDTLFDIGEAICFLLLLGGIIICIVQTVKANRESENGEQ